MIRNDSLQPIEILLVEDSPSDVLLAKEALGYSKLNNVLHVVKDGVEAGDFLNQAGKYQDAPRPDLILLDLNLPKKDGRELLAEIKSEDKLKRIPVLVLTTSAEQEDIYDSYGSHANCYIVKPVNFDKFANVVKEIESFWFSIVTLPSENR